MSRSPGFKNCVACAKCMPKCDPHSSCLWCLGQTHQKDLWSGRNPGSTLSNIFHGFCHHHATFCCASALGGYGPNASASSTVLNSDLGTFFHDVNTPIYHTCNVVDINLDAGTCGPSVNVSTRPPASGGSCESADTAPSCRTDAVATVRSDIHSPGAVSGTTSSDAAPGVI
ncbi:hypothetical protein UY3_11019 [Chelonia mydas]|uniref:Uncharacterized protein n=1 Tax=Chelonia mydas TaxID=8469 RepID=M7B1W7_CHEMY|nr:hypothetical protein UY3_11019 [Chelonia mydas]